MPQAANLILKNDANVDTTFTLYAPAGGQGSPALWKAKVGDNPALFPSVSIEARPTGNKSRVTVGKLVVPFQRADGTIGRRELNFKDTVPDDLPESMRDDPVAFATSLFANATVQAGLRDGIGHI